MGILLLLACMLSGCMAKTRLLTSSTYVDAGDGKSKVEACRGDSNAMVLLSPNVFHDTSEIRLFKESVYDKYLKIYPPPFVKTKDKKDVREVWNVLIALAVVPAYAVTGVVAMVQMQDQYHKSTTSVDKSKLPVCEESIITDPDLAHYPGKCLIILKKPLDVLQMRYQVEHMQCWAEE